MKKILCLILLLMLGTFSIGCSNKEREVKVIDENTPFNEIYEVMTEDDKTKYEKYMSELNIISDIMDSYEYQHQYSSDEKTKTLDKQLYYMNKLIELTEKYFSQK